MDECRTRLTTEAAVAGLARPGGGAAGGGRSMEAASLTPAEQRIARLVAVGLRNNEVAAELAISAKTVEWRLTRIYRKLGVRSRTELAVTFAHGGRNRGFPLGRERREMSRSADCGLAGPAVTSASRNGPGADGSTADRALLASNRLARSVQREGS